MADVTESQHPVLSVKVADNSRQSDGNTGWIGMPFLNLYRSYNKSFSDNNTSKVASKHLKGGKEPKMDVLVMENLLFKRNVTRLYDLKGSSRSRYNPDASGKNKVLLDQNLIEAMPTSQIFLGTKAKRLL